jgi:hypothetical protein
LSLDVGPAAKQAVPGRTQVIELSKFCRNEIQC